VPPAPAASKRLFLGLDSSTQGLKATAVDEHLNIVHRFAINYQKELGEAYGLVNGVHMKPETATVTQPSLMVRRPCAHLATAATDMLALSDRLSAVSFACCSTWMPWTSCSLR